MIHCEVYLHWLFALTWILFSYIFFMFILWLVAGSLGIGIGRIMVFKRTPILVSYYLRCWLFQVNIFKVTKWCLNNIWADASQGVWAQVTLNEEDLSYMLDETTPVKECGDLTYPVTHNSKPCTLIFFETFLSL